MNNCTSNRTTCRTAGPILIKSNASNETSTEIYAIAYAQCCDQLIVSIELASVLCEMAELQAAHTNDMNMMQMVCKKLSLLKQFINLF